ncbi:MAG: hypothetical protein H0X30_02505 [Anaerolineae bacterium]|nr:hypothetical protein [Anaerolineae bacterium]
MNEKSVFTAPNDLNIPIWRYMGFTKFVSMLQNQGLYFSRSDKLGDHFEGFYPQGTEDAHRGTREIIGESFGKLAINYLKNLDRRRVEIAQKYVMVNCWHMNKNESAAMWKIYGVSNEAVAIRSSYSSLRRCLDSSIDISTVDYVSDKEFISEYTGSPEQRVFIPFVHKREYFSYEQELRAIFSELSQDEKISDLGNPKVKIITVPRDDGVWQTADLNLLIDAVFVAPTAPVWFKDLVHQVSDKFGLNKAPIQSSLDKITHQ